MFEGKVVHFIGIGGISMSSLALMLKEQRAIVQGSDIQENDEIEILKNHNIKVFKEHCAENLKGVFAVCYSSAIHDDNVEIVEAKKQGLVIIKRAELLGLISKEFKTVIAVAGSHGKTTTTAMIAEMFIRANKKPTIHIGGVDNLIDSNFKIGEKDYFVVEACEYKDNFLYFKPDISVVLNVDADHLDYFGSLECVKKSFYKFAKSVKKGGVNIVSADDVNSKDLKKLDNVFLFGFDKWANLHASNVKEYKSGYYSFDVVFEKHIIGNIKLNILGKHNVYNALATLAVGFACMIDFCDIKYAIENYQGVKRRCEKVADVDEVEIFHDYAHHPEQIKKMIRIGKELAYKNKGKLFVVFEPHTYSRTKFLIDEFVGAFDGADVCVFAPAYSAREDQSEGVEADELADKVKGKVEFVEFLKTYQEIHCYIKKRVSKGDVVMILGAGTVDKLAKLFKEWFFIQKWGVMRNITPYFLSIYI